MGHVREYKGIQDLIEAGERLEDSASVDVYGPMFDDLDERIFADLKKVRYKGTLVPEELSDVLAGYHAAVLPPRAQTEGYPGAILESYMAGLPVIATTCGAIAEIVDEDSGILVPPRDPDDLLRAMTLLVNDAELYHRLCEGAANKAREFDSRLWAERFVTLCRQLHHGTCLKTLSVATEDDSTLRS
jgi:glycosyltransferase involved in cell wall biosynthesis